VPCQCCAGGCTRRFALLRALPVRHPERDGLRAELIEAHLGIASALACRFHGRGLPSEDVDQVAALALVQAVDRFSPEYGIPFVGFAAPTITGSIKRYFRDERWTICLPRGLKALVLEVSHATDQVTARLGRSPTVAEFAVALGRSERQVLEALRAQQAIHPLSLDTPVGAPDGDPTTLADTLGQDDSDLELIEYRAALRGLVEHLPARQRTILRLRFFDNLTQAQIGERIGCSQVQVSRLLAAALAHLRRGLLAAGPADTAAGSGRIRGLRPRVADHAGAAPRRQASPDACRMPSPPVWRHRTPSAHWAGRVPDRAPPRAPTAVLRPRPVAMAPRAPPTPGRVGQ
jgi:RNA polymerase sigma-B factor